MPFRKHSIIRFCLFNVLLSGITCVFLSLVKKTNCHFGSVICNHVFTNHFTFVPHLQMIVFKFLLCIYIWMNQEMSWNTVKFWTFPVKLWEIVTRLFTPHLVTLRTNISRKKHLKCVFKLFNPPQCLMSGHKESTACACTCLGEFSCESRWNITTCLQK